MAEHPLNLAIRFLLEITGLVGFALWGWHTPSVLWARVLPVIAVPLIAATAWGFHALAIVYGVVVVLQNIVSYERWKRLIT